MFPCMSEIDAIRIPDERTRCRSKRRSVPFIREASQFRASARAAMSDGGASCRFIDASFDGDVSHEEGVVNLSINSE